MGIGLQTMADFNDPELTSQQAYYNLFIRLALQGVNYKIGKEIDKTGLSEPQKYIYEQGVDGWCDETKDQTIVKPGQGQ